MKRITCAGLIELAAMENLQSLELSIGQLTDVELAAVRNPLRKLTTLQVLDLSGTEITDRGVKALAGCQLRSLALARDVQTDLGFKYYLASLNAPVEIELAQSKVTDKGLEELARTANVRVLNLSELRITDVGLRRLAGLGDLQELNLSGTDVADVGLRELAGLKKLQHIQLFGTRVTEQGVVALQKHLPHCRIDK